VSSSTGLSSFFPILSTARYSVTSVLIRNATAACQAQKLDNVHKAPPSFNHLENCQVCDRSVWDITYAFHSIGTGILSRLQGGRGVKLTTRLHPAPRLRMGGATLSAPHRTPRRGQEKLHLLLFFFFAFFFSKCF
jgi:hypothetical protein